MSIEAWEGNWRDRLRSQISDAGCKTVTEYLARSPSRSYEEMAKALGCAGMQVQALHMEEAKRFGALRAAAADALVRTLNEHLRMGWGNGMNFESRRATAYGMWMAVIGVHLQDDGTKERAKAVFSFLTELHPPKGWKPSSSEDPIMREAFDRAWSET